MPEKCVECGWNTISSYEQFDGSIAVDHECIKCMKICGEFVEHSQEVKRLLRPQGPEIRAEREPPTLICPVMYAWNGRAGLTLDEFVKLAVEYKNATDLFIRNVYALSRMRLRCCDEAEVGNWQACAEWCEALLGKPSLLRADPDNDTTGRE